MKILSSVLLPFAVHPSKQRVLISSTSRFPRTAATTIASSLVSFSTNSSNDNDPSSHTPQQPRTNIIHCNHAGASPSPSSVVDTVMKHLHLEQQVGGYTAADMAANDLHTVYQRVADLLHAPTQQPNNCNQQPERTTTTAKENTDDPTHEIALVESATVAWTRLFYSMAQFQQERRLKQQQQQQQSSSTQIPRPLVILVSEAEYAANVVAACQWARDQSANSLCPWTVLSIPSREDEDGSTKKSTGVVNLQVLQEMLQGAYQYQDITSSSSSSISTRTLDPSDIAMICITHIPTNSGIVNNVEEIGRLILEWNTKHNNNHQKTPNDDDVVPSILYLVDACQSVGQREICVDQIHCHGLVATGRKFLRGPRGTGFLYVPHHIANHFMPHHVDHFGVPVVRVPNNNSDGSRNNDNDNARTLPLPVEHMIQIQPKEGASRFEFYESNIANKLGLGEAIRYANEDIGMSKIQSTVSELALDLYNRLKDVDMVQVHHAPDCGIVTFYVPNIPSKVLKQRLWDGEVQFESSVVPATSTPLDSSRTQVPDLVRISLSYTNTVSDLDALCVKLPSIIT